jgi:homoserine dehydrogenase
LQALDRPGVLADMTRILADCGIGIEAFMQKEAPPSASVVPMVLLTNLSGATDESGHRRPRGTG